MLMTNAEICQALIHLAPETVWTLRGDTLDGLEWTGPSVAPTYNEVASAWAEIVELREQEASEKEAARSSARARLVAQGFTDSEIDVMYPSLVAPSAT